MNVFQPFCSQAQAFWSHVEVSGSGTSRRSLMRTSHSARTFMAVCCIICYQFCSSSCSKAKAMLLGSAHGTLRVEDLDSPSAWSDVVAVDCTFLPHGNCGLQELEQHIWKGRMFRINTSLDLGGAQNSELSKRKLDFWLRKWKTKPANAAYNVWWPRLHPVVGVAWETLSVFTFASLFV